MSNEKIAVLNFGKNQIVGTWIKDTQKAELVEVGGVEFWLPKSQAHAYTTFSGKEYCKIILEWANENDVCAGDVFWFELPEWLAQENNLNKYILESDQQDTEESNAGININDVEKWVLNNAPNAYSAVEDVISSPELSINDADMIVWDDGCLPGNVKEFMNGAIACLDVWAHDPHFETSADKIEDYEGAISSIEIALGQRPPLTVREYKLQGYENVEKTVRSGNNSSARIYVPFSWQGKRVVVIRLDP